MTQLVDGDAATAVRVGIFVAAERQGSGSLLRMLALQRVCRPGAPNAQRQRELFMWLMDNSYQLRQ